MKQAVDLPWLPMKCAASPDARKTSAAEIHQMIEELQIGARESVTSMTESQQHSEESVSIANLAGKRLNSVT